MEASKKVKIYGDKNDLLERIARDKMFDISIKELQKILDPKLYIGRAPQQVEEFIESEIYPILEANKDILGMGSEIHV